MVTAGERCVGAARLTRHAGIKWVLDPEFDLARSLPFAVYSCRVTGTGTLVSPPILLTHSYICIYIYIYTYIHTYIYEYRDERIPTRHRLSQGVSNRGAGYTSNVANIASHLPTSRLRSNLPARDCCVSQGQGEQVRGYRRGPRYI